MFMALASSNAHAAGSLSNRHVVDIGCGGVVCWATLDGDPGPSLTGTTCVGGSTLEFRWDATTPAGKLTYGSLLAAYTAGKQVSIYYDSCFAGGWNGTYVTINYFHITG